MKNVKTILLKVELKGNGIVNFDSGDQKYLWNKNASDNGQEKSLYDNVSFAKKRWYKENGKTTHKIIISSNCLRHNIFSDDVLFQSPNIMNNKNLLYSMIGSPGSLLRGYLFTQKDVTSIHRSSVLNITDAQQTNEAISSIETFARSGEKVSDENKSDTSFFKKESIGDITYEALGSIDLMQLQFISCDEIFDRLAFNPDDFEEYKKSMVTRFPDFNPTLGFYQIKNSVIELPEYGIKLSKENTVSLTKELLTRILNTNIRTSGAYAEVVKVSYKLVFDAFENKMSNKDGWVEIDQKSINDLDFEPQDYYVEYNSETASELRKSLIEISRLKKEKNKEDAEAKVKEKKKTKTEK